METTAKIFVRVLSEGVWFGAWAPIAALPKSGEDQVFILAANELTEDDEYEFFEPGTEVRVEIFMDEYGEEFLGAMEAIGQGAGSGHKSVFS